jgi:hypothetical protein
MLLSCLTFRFTAKGTPTSSILLDLLKRCNHQLQLIRRPLSSIAPLLQLQQLARWVAPTCFYPLVTTHIGIILPHPLRLLQRPPIILVS